MYFALFSKLLAANACLIAAYLVFFNASAQGLLLVTMALCIALSATFSSTFSKAAYTTWILSAVTAAMVFPQFFSQIGRLDLKNLIIPLLQVIMFGMGTAMSIKDFSGVIKMPKAVGIGLACQLTIMPIIGFTLAYSFGFAPEIAAGIILVGCSPSGLASNVMAYISKSNLALSVTLTAVATLLSPLTTPFLMKTLAGELIEINTLNMMISITKIVILPIIAGLIFNHFFHGKVAWLDKGMPIVSMVGIALIITVITAAGRDHLINIGLLLIVVSLIHNLCGFSLSYGLARLCKLDIRSSRAIAFEVGMQNTGLASGIAVGLERVATLGLAPSVFGPMMNITGSSLASWWKSKEPVK